MPRPDMVIVPHDATVTAALDLAIAHGNSRMPLHGEDGDDIEGLIYTKDLIRAERDGSGDTPASDLKREVHFIPENKPVARLMREMQAGKFHLAIVADEYGGIAGLITLEDCLEELVGEIVDEYDIEELAIQRLPNGDYLVEGGLQVAELNEVLGAELPDEEWDTVGGFMFGTLEHVPAPGEAVELDGWRFTAEALDGRRVKLVRVTAVPTPAEAARAPPPSGRRPRRRPRRALTPATTVAAHGRLTRRQGRARHRRLTWHRQGHRRRVRRGRGQGHAGQPQAGRPRGGGDGDRRRRRRVRRPRRQAGGRRGLRRRHHRDVRRPRHPRQQRRGQPVLRRDHGGRRGPLRQDVRGQPARPGVLVAAGVGQGVEGQAGRDHQHGLGRRPAHRVRPRRLQRDQGGADPPHPAAGRRARPDPGGRHRPGAGADRLRLVPGGELR